MNILITGGAGFIGSHIAGHLVDQGHVVTVIDGLMSETTGCERNLVHVPKVRLLRSPIESCYELPDVLAASDLVIDCMGWTRHLRALEDPEYDLSLNVGSHLALLRALKQSSCEKVIYLGSRGQFGNTNSLLIAEDSPRNPIDIQGIHKTAAESHYRLFSKLTGKKSLSLIIGNTFGPRMPMEGSDIGLFGGFLRDVIDGNPIKLYGKSRFREFTYAPDLAAMISQICAVNWEGFDTLNIPGQSIELEELVKLMIRLLGKGNYTIEDWPDEVKAIDIGAACLDPTKFISRIGNFEPTPVQEAIRQTIAAQKIRTL